MDLSHVRIPALKPVIQVKVWFVKGQCLEDFGVMLWESFSCLVDFPTTRRRLSRWFCFL